jgi:sarcosine oxidase subunit gamma
MPEVHSALSGLATPRHESTPRDLAIDEISRRDLVQLAGWPESFEMVASRVSQLLGSTVPQETCRASATGETIVFMVGPGRLWLAAPVARNLGMQLRTMFTPHEAVVTDLGHSRTVIRITGTSATALLARGIAIDLDDGAFPVDRFAQTAIREVGVLLHRAAGESFDLYVPRSFAAWLWDWLTEAALSSVGK